MELCLTFKGIWKSRKQNLVDLVQKQKLIQQQGIKTHAAVLHCQYSREMIQNMVKVRMQLMIRPINGKFEEFHSFSLIDCRQLPAKGDFVMISYLPSDKSLVALL
jgi:hypothetical protein